ncbi:hypothetical protein [Cryobacterium sp. PH29-G1]|uniref:hypothetical protein n=1 Tax=Cryobacterium sp. PH29-G1 TaxID=3046211 RepID=UPI0024B993ED|nr:hypothetical protein [Cryobacterium sp. PH29-G1]MDJ0348389.1 hypothetical protein [Cryobacterium sp. PH29-G1]
MKIVKKYLLALPVAIALIATFGVTAASAATPEAVPADQTASFSAAATAELTQEQVDEAFAELEASSLPRVTETDGVTIQTRFQLTEDFGMTFAKPDPDVVTTQIAGGSDSGGWYIKFNQFDQDAIISGAGLALGTAICLIPAVGVVACAVVGTIITAGVLYLSYNGKCPNNKQLKVYLPNRVAGCVA